jgi:hypothetical protein
MENLCLQTGQRNVNRDSPVNGLEIVDYPGTGYRRGVEFGGWCVAILNHDEKFTRPDYVERHNKSDEVFVLLSGEASLVIGESRTVVKMVRGRVYNVRQGTWHQIVTVPGTSCLIVENADTDAGNSERKPL